MNYKRVFVPNSYVHLIIISYNRKDVFVENIELLRSSFKNAKQFFDFEVIAICVLSNHIHMILNPKIIQEYPKIITSIKYYFSKHYNVGVETPTYGYVNKGEKGVFQRRYYEHTICSQEELNNHINYIHYNPVKHGYAKCVKDWKYSSFHKFVENKLYDENWGSFEDIKKLKDLNFE